MTSGQETWAWLIGLFIIGILIGDKIARYIPFIVWFLFIIGSNYNMLKNHKIYNKSKKERRRDIISSIIEFSLFCTIYVLYFHVLT